MCIILHRQCHIPSDNHNVHAFYKRLRKRTVCTNTQSLAKYFNGTTATRKESFAAHLRERGIDVPLLFGRVEEAVRAVYLANERALQGYSLLWKDEGGNGMFEVSRVDLLVDAELRVYVLEVNANPNLGASGQYALNQNMFDQVVSHALSLAALEPSVISVNLYFTVSPSRIILWMSTELFHVLSICYRNEKGENLNTCEATTIVDFSMGLWASIAGEGLGF